MKKTTVKSIWIALAVHSVLLGGLMIYLTFSGLDQPKMAYINTGEVFQEFALTKDLQARLEQVKNQRSAVLDTLRLDLQMRAANIDQQNEEAVANFRKRQESYLMQERQFTEDNDRLTAEYNEQVAKQINQYVEEYGKARGYQYIYGADGSGSLMYAGEGENATKEVIAFINKRFEGLAVK